MATDSDSDTEFDYAVPIDPRMGPSVSSQVSMPFIPDARLMPLLPRLLARCSARQEFAFGLSFDPLLVDATCWHGYFPMAIDFGLPVFAIKLHRKRCAMPVEVCAWVVAHCASASASPCSRRALRPLQQNLHVSKSVKKACNKFTMSGERGERETGAARSPGSSPPSERSV